MNCELAQPRLTALLDGELSADTAAAVGRHLADCPTCAQAHADLAAVREMAIAWGIDAPDISARVMQAVIADDQHILLDEMRRLQAEMAGLRAEVAALRRLLPRTEALWTPTSRFDSLKDYPQMENDPWNLIRS